MKNKLILFLLLSLGFVLVGCGSFFEEEELQIASIETDTLDDGSTVVTIKYTDPEILPVKFTVPAGKTGPTGNGIKDIEITKSDNGFETFLEIFYTDTEETTKVTLNNGVSVSGIESVEDDNGKITHLVVKYSDGTKSDPIELVSGADGATFAGYESIQNSDGSQTVYFYFRKDNKIEPAIITIPAPEKGDAGRGIASISSVVDGDKYVLTITYNDGNELLGIPATVHKVDFTRPTQWLTGQGIPDNSKGIDGDFYYDTSNHDIYSKSGIWSLILDLNTDGSKGNTVTFNLNDYDSEVKASMSHSGSTFLTTQTFYEGRKDIPIPTRTGYNFIGWYTKEKLGPTATKLEDLTVITCDIEVYAIWEKIN